MSGGTLFSSEYCPGGQYSRGDIIHSDTGALVLVSVPDPTPTRGRGSGVADFFCILEAQEIARSTPDPFPHVGVGSGNETAGALASHAILQDMHRFQRSITDKRDNKKALMNIHLKELLKKWQTSLT